jgi:hypothetical protein
MAFPTLGYHAEWGLAPKNHNFTIAYGESYAERVVREYAGGGTIPSAVRRFLYRSHLAVC